MKRLIGAALAAMALGTPAFANEPYGIWETKRDRTGAYLHVRVHACDNDAAMLCGTVHKTFNTPHTEIVGRPIFWDLQVTSGNEWGDGTVWDAESDKNFNAKVILGSTRLRVEGCVGFLCDGQNWTRVE
ncbi:MAG: DUF2147 domain-containing protein [Yoonia sp.]|nr:DUF2147 domain-containing protein [Yoonia sp.]